MKFRKITIKNFGPVSEGVIVRKRINIFFGPNNSGKSLVSRLIHGINLLDSSKTTLPSSIQHKKRLLQKDLPLIYSRFIFDSAGFDEDEIITVGKKSCSIDIESSKPLTLKFPNPGPHSKLVYRLAQ